MSDTPACNTALIVGAGPGISASLARLLAKQKIKVALAARAIDKLSGLTQETGAKAFACDATKRDEVERLFADVEAAFGAPEAVVYNASFRTRGSIVDLDPAEVEKAIAVTAFGGFLVAQAAAKRMLGAGRGTILFTGAIASLRGGKGYAAFASAKFALRGVAQAMARELGPQNIHVAHLIIDAGVDTAFVKDRIRARGGDEAVARIEPDQLMNPDSIADAYWYLHQQKRDAWTFELDVRPYKETW